MSSLEFAEAARQMGHTIRANNHEVPTFRSPPKAPGQLRSLRRRSDGSVTISVALRGRSMAAILADMIDGVVAANELDGTSATSLREELWESMSDLLAPVVKPIGRPHLSMVQAA